MAIGSGSTVSFKPLHPTFGAECYGVDFSKPVPENVVTSIRDGMAKYGVLVFRGAQLDDARHVDFARQLGELDSSTVFIVPGQKYRLAPFNELTDVGNIEADGSVVQKDSLRYQLGKGNGLFHVDCSYNHRRVGFSILRAHQLPPKGTGGGTAFADTRTAYNDLDEETKDRIKDYVVWHSIWHSRRLAAPECEFLKHMAPENNTMARHKLVQLHEPSQRMNLYIAAHAHHIDGMTKEDSQPIIESLMQHATQDKYTFRVDWENDGDIIIWDNTCVMHRACGGSFEGKYIRDMRRATVLDASSTAWGLNTPQEGSTTTANTVPDDLEFPCGCHLHWQCALDESCHITFHLTCPSCGAHLVSNGPGPSVTNPVFHTSQAPAAILCRYTSDGGVEDNYDILPVLTEEAYLATHPADRRPRAFLTMCGEGDIDGAVELLKDAASEGDDVRAIVLHRDALQGNRSALQIALERSQEPAVWLLLYLASPRLPDEAFPEEVLAAARSMGVDRMPAGGGGEDITAVRDEEGRSAEDYARAMAPLWDRLVGAGVLRP